MKLFVNRSVIHGPWGGGNGAVRAILDNAHRHGVELGNPIPDTTLVMGIDRDGGFPGLEDLVNHKLANPGFRVFLRVNTCNMRRGQSKGLHAGQRLVVEWWKESGDPLRRMLARARPMYGTFNPVPPSEDDRLVACSPYLDGTIFVSNWMRDYFMQQGWACKNNVVIYNGVDHEAFKPAQVRAPGSKLRIVTAHWSDNANKGQDYYEWLDDFVGRHPDQFEYTYIGRTKAQFKNSKHVQPLFGRALGEELAKHDVCVNASRFDPGPNSVIESIACGLPTYVHKDGGGGVEFAGTDHVFGSFDDLEQLLLSGRHEENNFTPRHWPEFADDVFRFLQPSVTP